MNWKRVMLSVARSWNDTAHMKYRYDNWVGGLNGDWLISRQRFFGVAFLSGTA